MKQCRRQPLQHAVSVGLLIMSVFWILFFPWYLCFFMSIVLFQVLRKFWNRWKSRLEEKEEEQQQALTTVAYARYRYTEKCWEKVVQMWDLWTFDFLLKPGSTFGAWPFSCQLLLYFLWVVENLYPLLLCEMWEGDWFKPSSEACLDSLKMSPGPQLQSCQNKSITTAGVILI